MLYEVITLAAEYLLRSFELFSDDHTAKQAGTAEFLAAELIQAGKADTALSWYRKANRITSYNVCYTKLLRS